MAEGSDIGERKGAVASARDGDERAGGAPAKPSRLWLWFVAAFLVQLVAWATWLVIASQHRVQEVPLVQPR